MSRALSSNQLQETLNRLWTVQDLISRFRVTHQTIHNWRKESGLPAIDVPGTNRNTLRFIPEDVRAWAKRKQKKLYNS